MNASDLEKIAAKLPLSPSTRALNAARPPPRRNDAPATLTPSKRATGQQARVRQSQKPLMNHLESEWFSILSSQFPNYPRPRPQAKRYRLANGVGYTPDFTATSWPDDGDTPGPAMETAWEVKGAHSWDDAMVKVKVAASAWPEVRWLLVWKKDGHWFQQEVLP